MKQHKSIRILDQQTIGQGWEFVVAVDDFTFAVTLSQDYYQELTGGKVEPAKLIEAAFSYLLDKEPKDSILKQFDLRQIKTYFPSFEVDVKALI